MLKNILAGIADDDVYNAESLYKYCNEENCLSFSIQHFVVHVASLIGEYNSFVDVNFVSVHNQ